MASIEVSELRIVLLGKNSLEISRVGNFILRRDAFNNKAPPPSVEQHSERARGNVEGRYITLINTPHLFNPQLSQEELTHRMKECMFLSAPGPHAVVLVLQSDSFTETDRERLHHILFSLSEEPYKHSLTLTTQLLQSGSSIDPVQENIIPKIITACRNRHFRFSTECSRSALIEMIVKIVVENGGYYKWKKIVSSPLATVQRREQSTTHKESERTEQQNKNTQQQSKKNLSELRIVLLGKKRSDISRVGNSILGRDAFDIEAPPPSLEHHSERARGNVEGRYITLINTPHLFNVQLPQTELLHRVKECVYLCAPGPHVFLLVLQSVNFRKADLDRVKNVLNTYSPLSMKYSVVLTTDTDSGLKVCLQSLTNECEGRHLGYEEISKIENHQLLDTISAVVKQNGGDYLTCDLSAQLPVEFVLQKHSGSSGRDQACFTETAKTDGEKSRGLTYKKENAKPKVSEKLNLVLCGSDGAVTSSISDLILGQRERSTESSSVCVRREGEVCGCLVTLVEMPALYNTQLSEEEVMKETYRCVSLCDPGVHAFLFIIPDGPLTDEDKGEMEKTERIFGSRINNYLLLITPHSQNKQLSESVKTYERRYLTGSETDAEEVIQCVKKLLKKNNGSRFTAAMLTDAQIESQLKYKQEIEDLKKEIRDLKMSHNNQTQESSPDMGDLKVVLLGKTGIGKSAAGNTILRTKAFKELPSSRSVTSECQKESAEVGQRQITVIDTPGLFDTSISNEETRKEIAKCITMAAPGPHVFLLVLTVGRFTQEEHEAVKMIQDLFGDESRRYTIVLFTRGDDLEKTNTTVEKFIEDSDRSLQNIIYQCGNRYHMFNNRNTDHSQVTALLEKIESMVKVNGGSCYTNEMFQQVEKELQEEQQIILKEKEKKIEREKEDLRAKYEAEMEKLKRTMEQERQKLEKERREKEEEFQKKEAQIKKETNEELKREMDKKLKEQQEAFNEKINKTDQDHREQLLKDLEYHTQRYEREQENIRNQAERAARQQAEEEFCTKLEKEVAKARREAYEEGKRDAESNDKGLVHILGEKAGILGGAVGAAVGGPVGGFIGGLIGDIVWEYIMGKKNK